MLQLDRVSYSYAGGGQDVPAAVRDASLTIEPGTLVGLLGHNGSGKSTLAKLMSGVLLPQSGRVTADGFDTHDREGVWAVRERVGLVFQNPDDQLVTNTLLDEIAFGPENLGLPRDEIERRVAGAIRLLGLERYIDVPLNELSIGQRQRVAVAGVLAMRPRYIVLDEPTTMLPHHLAVDLLDTLRQLAREDGVGVIYITHRVEEITRFDRVLVADRGELVLDGTPRSIFGAPDALIRVGLEPPIATRIAADLRARGVPLPEGILTGEELAKAFQMLGAQRLAPGRRSRPASHPEPPATRQPVSPEAPDPVLETRDVRHVYLRGTPFEQMGLDRLSMTVPRGAFVACVGPTRSGKSTLADCLNGIIRPGRGMVFFSGQDVAAPGFDLDRLREAVGVVYQNPESQILKDIVGKDISFGPMRKKVSLADSRQIVRESLEAVGLPYEEFRNRYTYALSGGEKRRVAIAGVLAMRPSVLVLDEPVAGLDPRGRAEFLALIRRLHTEGELTIVYLSASLEDALDLATDVYVMDAGRVAFTGAPAEILERLDELDAMHIGLPEISRVALKLQRALPGLRTDCLTAGELVDAVMAQLADYETITRDHAAVAGEETAHD